MSNVTRDIFDDPSDNHPDLLDNLNNLDIMLSDFWVRFNRNIGNFRAAKDILMHFLIAIRSLQHHINEKHKKLISGNGSLDDLQHFHGCTCRYISLFTKRRRDLEEIADLLDYLNTDMNTKSMMPWFDPDS